MTQDRSVLVEGQYYYVTISDEQEALLAAYAAGRAIIGIWREGGENSLEPACYAVEHVEDADQEFVERVVRRHLGLPWIIAQTPRLLIRELSRLDLEGLSKEEDEMPGEAVFQNEEALLAYIEKQYGFFEYGIWAIVEKETDTLIGRVGICNLNQEEWNWVESGDRIENGDQAGNAPLELGYHIFASYRRQGYGREACAAVLAYASVHMPGRLYARISPKNTPSLKLAETFGFRLIAKQYSAGVLCRYLYERN